MIINYIHIGNKENNISFDKQNEESFISHLKNNFITKYNRLNYKEKTIYDENMRFLVNNSKYNAYIFKLIETSFKNDTMFYESYEIKNVKNINFNLKKKYNYEESFDILEFVINEKISVIFNDRNHLKIKIIKDEFWDKTKELDNIIDNIYALQTYHESHRNSYFYYISSFHTIVFCYRVNFKNNR